MSEDAAAREAYLRGRLEGLKQLVGVLDEALDQGGGEAIEKKLVSHVSAEIEELISELKEGMPERKMREFEEKHEELKQVAEEQPLSKTHVKKADELMQSLLDMQK
ncbi:hypothetical protein J4220_00225 [Candidatus Micrarchaeota archaeon]|nr:hypothetical protein [Candidatus Micrarchaeota archaeon]